MPAQKTTATEEYARIYQMLSRLTTNMSVVAFAGPDRIKEFEATAKTDPLMSDLIGELRDRLAAVHGAEAFTEMSQAYEAFAETNFVYEMIRRNVRLERTPGTGEDRQKRPDFLHPHRSGNIYFEVKALEIADPISRNREIAYDALDTATDLDQRSRKPGVHFGETALSGFRPGSTASQRVDLVTGRLNNALKRDQLRYGPTMLVIDLGRLPGVNFGSAELVPVFFHDTPPAESCVSGELWHVALGCIGERMFRLPEFDGASNLDGQLTRQGLLRDYPELCGITFVHPRWNRPSELLTIWNVSPDQANLVHKLALTEHEIGSLIDQYSDVWNDTRNQHGWLYRVFPLRP